MVRIHLVGMLDEGSTQCMGRGGNRRVPVLQVQQRDRRHLLHCSLRVRVRQSSLGQHDGAGQAHWLATTARRTLP